MRFCVDLRKNDGMAQAIDQAIASLTPDSHTDALRIMSGARAPVAVISRVVFGKDRLRGRRRDVETAQVFDRALAIVKLYGMDDAEAYFALKNLTASLVVRVLSDGPHRGDQDWQMQWITPEAQAQADQAQRPAADATQPFHADAAVNSSPRRRETANPRDSSQRLHPVRTSCAALAGVVSRAANWLWRTLPG